MFKEKFVDSHKGLSVLPLIIFNHQLSANMKVLKNFFFLTYLNYFLQHHNG